jgi:predicted transport protein
VDPDDWLPAAVANNSIQHVVLLASRGPSKLSLDRAFEAAISANTSLAIIEELLRYGVDPNGHTNKLSMLVHQNRTDVLEVFLRSQHPLQPVQLNTTLSQAVDQKNQDLVAILLTYGADPNYAGAKSFLDMVKTTNFSMTLLLLANALPPVKVCSEYLDHAVALVVGNSRASEEQRGAFLDALISAGASKTSKPLEDELFRVVETGNMKTISLLVSCGVSIDHGEARSIRKSLELRNLGVFDMLLRGQVTYNDLAKVVPQAMALVDPSERRHVMQLLLSRGARGAEVSQALVKTIEQEDQKLFDELLAAIPDGATSDVHALEVAFRARDPSYLERLCAGKSLDYKTTAHLVPLVLLPDHYDQSRSLLIVQASTSHANVFNKALIDEVAVHGARENIIALLLQHGASVDFSNGAALYQAALSGKERTVQQLTAAGPSHLTLHSAFRAAMSLVEVSIRASIMKTLLGRAGDQKIGQDDALIQEVKSAATVGTDIVALLLSHKASVDHQEGDAVKNAVVTRSSNTLQLLLAAHPGKETLVMAFTQCMSLPKSTRIEFVSMIAKQAMQSAIALPVGLYLQQAIAEGDLELCKLLLHYGADPNTEHGKAFIQAAQLESTSIFEELLVYRPDIKRLLPALIRELNDEDKVVACLALCFEHLQIQLNPSENVLLFLALDQFEEGEKLVRFLLNVGCSVGATRELQLRETSEIESVTPLIWALSRPLPGPSRAVLMALLERGVEGNAMCEIN